MTQQQQTTQTKKTHHGSCHCGAVRFEVDVDASHGTQCNCRICRKLNPVTQNLKPADFRLVAGQASLTTYPNSVGARYFCRVCGVLVYGDGDLPALGGAFVSVNLNALDDIDVAHDVDVGHWDGRHDNWQAGLRRTPWPITAA